MLDRINLNAAVPTPVVAHGGTGTLLFKRLAERRDLSGGCNFIDHAILPPGVSIGRHRHGTTQEEFYLVLAGEGRLWRDGGSVEITQGDLIRNPPGAAHGLENTGSKPLSLFVFELEVSPS